MDKWLAELVQHFPYKGVYIGIMSPPVLYVLFFFLFRGHEPLYFTENKEKTLRVSYDRDTHTIEYMN